MNDNCWQPEKRKAPAYRRQAQDEPHGKVFFTFLGGLACDLEPMAPGARPLSQFRKVINPCIAGKVDFFFIITYTIIRILPLVLLLEY
jgi:hypothetical protein